MGYFFESGGIVEVVVDAVEAVGERFGAPAAVG